MVYIPRDYVELDCREEGKVNLPEIHVTSDARGDWMELREAKLLQIIREMFGGMENSFIFNLNRMNLRTTYNHSHMPNRRMNEG